MFSTAVPFLVAFSTGGASCIALVAAVPTKEQLGPCFVAPDQLSRSDAPRLVDQLADIPGVEGERSFRHAMLAEGGGSVRVKGDTATSRQEYQSTFVLFTLIGAGALVTYQSEQQSLTVR